MQKNTKEYIKQEFVGSQQSHMTVVMVKNVLEAV